MSEARLRELLAEYAADEPPMRLRPEQVMHVRVRSPWRVTLAAAVSAALLVGGVWGPCTWSTTGPTTTPAWQSRRDLRLRNGFRPLRLPRRCWRPSGSWVSRHTQRGPSTGWMPPHGP